MEESILSDGLLFKEIVDKAGEEFYLVRPDGELVYINEAAARSLGYTAEEMLRMKISDIDPKFGPAYRKHFNELKRRDIPPFITEHIARNGNIVQKEVKSVYLRLKEQEFVCAFGRDISERIEARKTLDQTEKEWSLAMDFVEDVIYLVDMDDRIVQANSNFFRMTGLPRKKVIGADLVSIIHPKGEAVPCPVCRARLSREDAFITMENGDPNNPLPAPIEVMVKIIRDERGEPVRILMGIRDLSKIERIRQQSQIIDQTHEAIILLQRDGCIESWNKGAEKMFGIAGHDVEGKNIYNFLPENSQNVLADLLTEEMTESGQKKEIILQNRVGGGFWALASVAEMGGHGGRKSGYILTLFNISEQKHLESQLHQAQKMEAMGRLAGGVAHDFNNVLTSVLGYSEMLLDGLAEDHPFQEDLKEIYDAGQRATGLVQQLLAFSRKQSLETQPVHLNQIIENLTRMLKRIIGEDITLTIDLAAEKDLIRGDTGQIEQVLMNLMVNARDAMPHGGSLTIRTLMDKNGPAAGDRVILEISDTGYGMSTEVQERIFEPFFTTKECGKGTGLGLSTAYGIVKQHEGHITLDSQPGSGAVFTIYLPLTVDRYETPAAAEHSFKDIKGHETLLVVDDERQILHMLEKIFILQGYTVLTASSGAEALQCADSHEGEIDLLVTDVIMAGMTGRELARHITEKRRDIKILYVSGYTDEVIGRHGVLEKGISYLPKPIRPAEIGKKVRQILDSR